MAIYQFPGTNFHDLNLDWLLEQMKNCLAEWATTHTEWETLAADNATFKTTIEAEWDELRTFVTNYFANLDVSEEVAAKIDEMANDGSLLAVIRTTVENSTGTATAAWLNTHVDPSTGYVIDNTLTIPNAAADSATVGNVTGNITESIIDSGAGITFAFPIPAFKAKSKYTTTTTDDDTHALITSIKIPFPIRIRWKVEYSVKIWQDSTLTTETFVPANTPVRIEIWRNDSEVFNGTDANGGALWVECSQDAYDWLYNEYYLVPGFIIPVTKDDMSQYTRPFCLGYYDASINMIRRGRTYTVVSTNIVVVNENSMVIGMSGPSATNNPYATWYRVDDTTQEPIVITYRHTALIPPGQYIVTYVSDSNHTATYNPASGGAIVNFARSDTITGRNVSGTTITNAITGAMTGGCHCSAMDGMGRTWYISLDGTYCVIRDTDYTTKRVELPIAGQHDNNVSIVGNHMYVSDWYSPIVYDYTIDFETDTITGYEVINLPVTDEDKIQADFISETEAITAGWDASPRSYVRISRILKGAQTWFVADTFCIKPSSSIMQGMRVQDNKLFILFNTSAYVAHDITVVDLDKHRVVAINNTTSPASENESLEISTIANGHVRITTVSYNQYMALVTYQNGAQYVYRINAE